MNLVVDTSVWSLVLRRHSIDETHHHVRTFRHYLDQGACFHLLGNILQELLDGVKNKIDFDRLVEIMRPFPLVIPARESYVFASQLRNLCRTKGIQAAPVDFLIAATCIERGYPLLTADDDFSSISKHCNLQLAPCGA